MKHRKYYVKMFPDCRFDDKLWSHIRFSVFTIFGDQYFATKVRFFIHRHRLQIHKKDHKNLNSHWSWKCSFYFDLQKSFSLFLKIKFLAFVSEYVNISHDTFHDFLKVKLLTVYNVMHKFDITCVSESYLNSDTSWSDDNLNIPGYMSRAEHPSGNRRGGVCIYYKEPLPIKMLIINYLQEYICFDLKIGSKPCTFVLLYRSPSQSPVEFEIF